MPPMYTISLLIFTKIVFIHSKNKLNECWVNATYKCQVCGYELIDHLEIFTTEERDSFKFGSIACKVRCIFFFQYIFYLLMF